MDQNEQRDHVDEAYTREEYRREQEEEAAAQDAYDHYTAELIVLGRETPAIRIADGMGEVEFYVEPEAWPVLRVKIDAAWEEWLVKYGAANATHKQPKV